jgi:hypothetical protein
VASGGCGWPPGGFTDSQGSHGLPQKGHRVTTVVSRSGLRRFTSGLKLVAGGFSGVVGGLSGVTGSLTEVGGS